ncbi:MAG: hypothetical protein OXC40_07315, partial [Proteobacteria bacterium]|nr:hypothetical protein [Pseudomonadota bacterium]
GGVVQGKGGVVQGKGGVVQGKGGILQGKGGVVQGKGGVVQGKGGVVQGKGGVVQGKGGVVQGKGGVQQQMGVHQKGYVAGTNSVDTQTYTGSSYQEGFQAFSGTHGFESVVPSTNACAQKTNHHISYNGQTYSLERYATTMYANLDLSSGEVGLSNFATILFESLFEMDGSSLGVAVVKSGQILDSQPLTFSLDGLVFNERADMPVGQISKGYFQVATNDPSLGYREYKIDLGSMASCVAMYISSSGEYLENKLPVIVLPSMSQ